MTFRPRTLMAVAVAMSLGLVACTEAEQDEAQAETNEAAAETGMVASEVGDDLQAGAAQAGEVIESGAMKAAQA
jgi:putative hemolysin